MTNSNEHGRYPVVLLKTMHINGKTQLTALIGWPVSHTDSPAIHQTLAADTSTNIIYVPLPVHPNNLLAAVRGLAAAGFRGATVTMPHKEAIIPLLDHIDPAAATIGAVNTLLIKPRTETQAAELSGYNTDWLGFLADLAEHKVDVKGRGCMILGAGGAARAVAYGLLTAGARVHLFARNPAQSAQVAKQLAPLFPNEHISYHLFNEGAQVMSQWKSPLIINATPLGMPAQIDQSIWPEHWQFPTNAIAYDLIYNPTSTRFLQQAAMAQCSAVINGRGMLAKQAKAAFKLWTSN